MSHTTSFKSTSHLERVLHAQKLSLMFKCWYFGNTECDVMFARTNARLKRILENPGQPLDCATVPPSPGHRSRETPSPSSQTALTIQRCKIQILDFPTHNLFPLVQHISSSCAEDSKYKNIHSFQNKPGSCCTFNPSLFLQLGFIFPHD